ncbi:hypothetical protein BJX76DRAFT_366559 [Aspergillus varians]
MGRVSKLLKATKFNIHTLKKLEDAFKSDLEVDLTTKLPTDYSTQLDSWHSIRVDNHNNIRDSLDASALVKTIYPLSKSVLDLLESSGLISDSFLVRLIGIIQASEILWRGPSARCKMVFKCNTCIVLKAVQDMTDFTKHVAIKQHCPCFHELLVWQHAYVWWTLDKAQKASIQEQLDKILTDLRSLPFTPGTALGGIGGKGCKNVKRHLCYRTGGDAFLLLINKLCPPALSYRIVFTHGDLRPDNITVKMAEDHGYIVTGLIDWEYSGFYPEYYEAAKTTNCLLPYEQDNWYLFLPDCISPKRYAYWWLLNRVRETRVL